MVYQNPANGSTMFYPNQSLGYQPMQQQQMIQPQVAQMSQQNQIPQQQMIQQTPQQTFVPQQQQIVFPQITLNGKIVDGKAMVGVSDVPVGGYGFFPKADLSEIYVKRWNEYGTTNTTTYRPVPEDQLNEQGTINNVTINQLVEQMNRLENKLDGLAAVASQQNVQQSVQSDKQDQSAVQTQTPQQVQSIQQQNTFDFK